MKGCVAVMFLSFSLTIKQGKTKYLLIETKSENETSKVIEENDLKANEGVDYFDSCHNFRKEMESENPRGEDYMVNLKPNADGEKFYIGQTTTFQGGKLPSKWVPGLKKVAQEGEGLIIVKCNHIMKIMGAKEAADKMGRKADGKVLWLIKNPDQTDIDSGIGEELKEWDLDSYKKYMNRCVFNCKIDKAGYVSKKCN